MGEVELVGFSSLISEYKLSKEERENLTLDSHDIAICLDKDSWEPYIFNNGSWRPVDAERDKKFLIEEERK